MSIPGKKRFCIFGCDHLGASMHGFPSPDRKPELFTRWLSIVGDKCKETDPWKIYKSKKVCDHHFTPDQKVYGHRLAYMAIPTVNLDGVFLTPCVQQQLEHNYCLPNVGNTASHSASQPRASDVVPCAQEEIKERLEPSEQPSTSKTSYDGLKSPETHLKKYKTAQKEVRKLRAQLSKSIKKEKNFKTRLAVASSLLKGSDAFERVTKHMTRSGKIFTGIQYRQALKKPKGRRYNVEEKVLALSIYKKSPKCYNMMYRYFKLPSAKSLKMLLGEINITPGINHCIFEKLKETVHNLIEDDRLCTLMFDEMSLTPHVQYNSANDELKGFISHDSASLKLANHAMVFMVKGVKKNFKQPVAYYFTQSLKTEELKQIITEVLIHVQGTGLKVICTVCDQGAANVSAINSLVKQTKEKYLRDGREWRQEQFEVAGQKIIPLYDVPHLIKGLRNNLLNKDLIYKDKDGKEKIVKWNFFEQLYQADKTRGELRCLHKLTEEHIHLAKIKKMRVKMAAQVFSHSVAVTTDHFIARGLLPDECRQLVPLVLLIDQLFDSLNAGTFHIPNGKVYRAAVRKSSPHHKLWIEGINFLKNIKFIAKKRNSDKIQHIPTIKNLIKTIEGMQAIWKILTKKYSLDCMLTRNFNQDPIENFFGSIRSLGARNVSPNCTSFEGAFKSLLLNNFSSHHAVNANCEEDFNTCLQTFDFFLKEKKSKGNNAHETQIHISSELFQTLTNVSPTNDVSSPTQARYVCGWVLTKCLGKIIKKCKTCRDTLVLKNNNQRNCFIQAKEYDKTKRWLCYPSDQLSKCFREIQEITVTFLKTSVQKQGLKENIMYLTNSFVTFPCNCEEHKESVQNYFTKTTIDVLIFSWCRSINRILSGKITYTDTDDQIKLSAAKYYNTHRHIK